MEMKCMRMGDDFRSVQVSVLNSVTFSGFADF